MKPIGTKTAETIALAMRVLEDIPQGGVGEDGCTLEEIEEAERRHEVVTNDAAYHQVQKAWLLLNQLMESP